MRSEVRCWPLFPSGAPLWLRAPLLLSQAGDSLMLLVFASGRVQVLLGPPFWMRCIF